MVVSAGLNPRVFKQARGGAPRRGARRQLLSIGPVVQAATLPKSRLARWLIAPGRDVDPVLAAQLASGLYTSIPIFLGGVINSIVVAAIGAARHPEPLFLLWLVTEVLLGLVRLAVLVAGRRAQRQGAAPPVTLAVALSCAWAASVGYGASISLASEDWILATIACLSAAAMVSGICLRNFGTPRLATVMMMLSLIPCALAALLARESVLAVVTVQLPIYMAAIGSAAFRLNRMMVDRMVAQNALEKSEALNRCILESSPDYTLLLDEQCRIVFCNRPQAGQGEPSAIIGKRWLDILPAENRADGKSALGRATAGETTRLTIAHADANGRRWFDLAVSGVADGSSRVLIVARDITHQKASEDHAVWMANHDPLTQLPNRVVLQDRLEQVSAGAADLAGAALLVLDIDNFKMINDTLGHDAGDALLCAFAARLRKAVRSDDLIARLGGDEFAILLQARTDAEVQAAADKIYAELHQPFVHDGRLIECNASIGACFSPRDGRERSELMKAADIALYSAKSGGRGQLKIFRSSMRNAFQSRNSMLSLARIALASNDVLPYYQPKVGLRTGAIVGFEALLRWRDPGGRLRLPDKLHAAFDDPVLSRTISDRIIDQSLADIRAWLDRGIDFGHVAINVAAAEFRSGHFDEALLAKLAASDIPSSALQIEVTETVLLGRGADHVERALRRLRAAGLRIALDDFGTGYASLAHLMHFPVDALKIDKSFIRAIGRNGDAEAITRTIINLGHSLDIEIIAEGVEHPEQEMYLVGHGCQTGQGYLYSRAVPAETVPQMLAGSLARTG
jgi:diguanylate cyclase (GGDEF)-like protein/PAS domain S-box-containing protein